MALLISFLILNLQLFSQTTVCKVWDQESFINGRKRYVDASWTGSVYKGKANGYGTVYFKDGSRFEGTLNNGIPNGVGKFLNSTGGTLSIGNYRDGMYEGKFVFIFSEPFRMDWNERGRVRAIEIKSLSGNYPYKGIPDHFAAYDTKGQCVGVYRHDQGKTYIFEAQKSGDIVSELLSVIGGTALFLAGATIVVATAAIIATTPSSRLFWLIIIVPK